MRTKREVNIWSNLHRGLEASGILLDIRCCSEIPISFRKPGQIWRGPSSLVGRAVSLNTVAGFAILVFLAPQRAAKPKRPIRELSPPTGLQPLSLAREHESQLCWVSRSRLCAHRNHTFTLHGPSHLPCFNTAQKLIACRRQWLSLNTRIRLPACAPPYLVHWDQAEGAGILYLARIVGLQSGSTPFRMAHSL